MDEAFTLLLTGILVCLALLIHWGSRKTSVPALVGYLILGFLLRVADGPGQFLTEPIVTRLDFLANIGVVVLLFRVGLHSNLAALLQQLRTARAIWLGNVLLSGVAGYLTAHYLLGFATLPSMYVAVALTATSVGVSVGIWEESEALESSAGQTLVDVAEMDDISAVILMSVLLAVTPALQTGSSDAILSAVFRAGGVVIAKLLLFGGFCYAFSRFGERPLTRLYARVAPMPDPMLMLVATGFVIAAFAGLLGFSIAIGAFFGGLVFSRDPEAVTLTRPFAVLYDLFTPFFFISIGLHIDPPALITATTGGMVLFAAAALGKFFGAAGAALSSFGWSGAVLLGVSMIPRAEIAMILMRQGQQLGDSVVPPGAYAAMVFVAATTCIVSPLILRPLLDRWAKQPQRETEQE
ncbi:MAG: cation:proton antiporter [Candidatus Paceibacterota bacterium]